MPIRETQSTNKQHAIPQSIMSVEFKLIGDLTLKQFFFLMIFFGLAYVCFMLFSNPILKWGGVGIFCLIGLAFAFIPFGERGLDQWIVNFVKAMYVPNQFIWKKVALVPNVFSYQNIDILKSELITLSPTASRRKIEAFLQTQERPKDDFEKLEESYVDKIRVAYAQMPRTQVSVELSDLPQTQPQTITSVPTSPSLELPAPKTPGQKTLEQVALDQKPNEASKQEPTQQIPQNILQNASKQEEESQISLESPDQKTLTQQIPEKQEKIKKYVSPENVVSGQNTYALPMTPDMHVGRRFINLSQASGKIILPVRGERTLKTSEETRFEEDTQLKAKQLDALLAQIKQEENTQTKLQASAMIDKEKNDLLKKEVDETERKKQDELKLEEEKIRKEREELERAKRIEEEHQEQLKREEEDRHRAMQQTIVAPEVKVPLMQTTFIKPEPLSETPIPLTSPQKAENETAPTLPNVVFAVVKSPAPQLNGVGGVVAVIKNERNEVVRAVKTNGEGRFGISTPLSNGRYMIQVDKEGTSGFVFDAVGFEAKGEVIPTIQIIGRV